MKRKPKPTLPKTTKQRKALHRIERYLEANPLAKVRGRHFLRAFAKVSFLECQQAGVDPGKLGEAVAKFGDRALRRG